MARIAVIEDSFFARTTAINLLKQAGFNDISDFESADDICRYPQKYLKDIDLIITDIALPGISGIDFVKFLKGSTKYKNIPVIFMSGLTDYKTISEAANVGAADFIVKPFENDVFVGKIIQVLGKPSLIPDEFFYSETKFERLISIEYDRAKRSGSFLSIIKIKVHKNQIVTCLEKISEMLRKIDTACFYKNTILILLPLTNEAGAHIVHEKINQRLKQNEVELLADSVIVYDPGNIQDYEPLYDKIIDMTY